MQVDNSMLDEVKKARALEEVGSIDDAINSYLNAAQIAVEMIKASRNEGRRDLLKQISTDIIAHVKFLKQNKEKPVKTIDEAESTHKSVISHMMLVSNSGTQIMSYGFDDGGAGDIAKNDILFSSAITAIGSIFNETVHKSIEEIRLDDMWLHFVKEAEFLSIIFVHSVSNKLVEAHKKAVDYLKSNYSEAINDGLTRGIQIQVNDDMATHLRDFFANCNYT